MKSIAIKLKHLGLSTTRNFFRNGPPHYLKVVKITSYYMEGITNIPENKMRKLQTKVKSNWEKYSSIRIQKKKCCKIVARLSKRNTV